MTIKKIGLSALLFSVVLLTAGAATQVQAYAATGDSTTSTTKATAASSDTVTHGAVDGTSYAVWATLPGGSTVDLAGPAGFVYALFNSQGVSAQRGLAGDSNWSTDQLELSLQPRNAANVTDPSSPANSKNYNTAGLFVRVSTDEWVKVVGPGTFGVTLIAGDSKLSNNGGSNPTNLVINFTDQNGKAAQASLVLPISTPTTSTGKDITDMVHTLQADLAQTHYDIPGYTLRDDATVTSDGFTTTIHYIKNADPVKPGGGGNGGSNTTNSSSSSASESSTADKPATKPVAVKGEAVYATKAIGLYQSPNFTKATRKHSYAKESRTERPQFVVTGYARAKNGALRYQVRDVNHTKTTDKLRGYITADDVYVDSTYYQTTPKRIKVLNRHGLNAYRDADLTGESQHHYSRGSILKVTASKAYHLTNRFILPNGHYVSANKVLVIKK